MNVSYLDRFGPWIGLMFLGLLIFHSTFPQSQLYIGKFEIAFGVPSLWWLTGIAARNAALKSFLIGLSNASFFVFAAHEPLLIIVRKLVYKLLSPVNGAAILALYFLIPVFLIILLVAVHRYLLKTVPSFTGFITGRVSRSAFIARSDDSPVAAVGVVAGASRPASYRI
jgi:hypothetical protein